MSEFIKTNEIEWLKPNAKTYEAEGDLGEVMWVALVWKKEDASAWEVWVEFHDAAPGRYGDADELLDEIRFSVPGPSEALRHVETILRSWRDVREDEAW